MDLKRQKLRRFLAHARVLFPQDAARVARARYGVLTYLPSATPARVHLYGAAARFDTLSIYQVAKHVFRDRPAMLRALFPSEVILRSLEALPAEETFELGAPADAEPEHPKLALLELFNAFRTGAPAGAAPYYYLPFREDVDHVVL